MDYSIITPVYNRQDCILRCLASVAKCVASCGGTSLEHIIVDDGSSDDSLKIAIEFAKSHPYVRCICFDSNKGTNAARNAAIKAAKGKWCVILDSDDYFVETAIHDIKTTMQVNPDFGHYMFAADDMLDFYEKTDLLRGKKQVVFSYKDFLSGNVSGDFIHVCNTDVLKKYPFDENIRIHEGIFFLMFYREVQKMLFTNIVVTIRERQRGDSVSRDTFRTNKKVIQRVIRSNELYLNTFTSDLEKNKFFDVLNRERISLLDNYVLIGRNKDAKRLYPLIKEKSKKVKFLLMINELNLSSLYRLALKVYLVTKYTILKKDMKM